MKRKLLSLVLSMAIVMSTGITAMATDAPPSLEGNMKSIVTTVAATGEVKDGLHVSLFDDVKGDVKSDDQSPVGYWGIISQDDMEKIISELKLSDNESKELMDKFLKLKELSSKTDEVSDKTNKEISKLFTGKVLEKAIDLKLLTEVFSASLSEASNMEAAVMVKSIVPETVK